MTTIQKIALRLRQHEWEQRGKVCPVVRQAVEMMAQRYTAAGKKSLHDLEGSLRLAFADQQEFQQLGAKLILEVALHLTLARRNLPALRDAETPLPGKIPDADKHPDTVQVQVWVGQPSSVTATTVPAWHISREFLSSNRPVDYARLQQEECSRQAYYRHLAERSHASNFDP